MKSLYKATKIQKFKKKQWKLFIPLEAPASAPSTSKEMPSDKLLKLSVEQTDLLRRKVEAKEEMVALQRESLLLQGRQAVAIENAAASFTDTMKMWV